MSRTSADYAHRCSCGRDIALDLNITCRYHLDLCAAVPYFTMNQTMRKMIWDDGLHLTMDGYKMMGDVIATKLLGLVNVVGRHPILDEIGAD